MRGCGVLHNPPGVDSRREGTYARFSARVRKLLQAPDRPGQGGPRGGLAEPFQALRHAAQRERRGVRPDPAVPPCLAFMIPRVQARESPALPSAASLSRRSPWNLAWRTCPAAVHSVNATWPTGRGLHPVAPRTRQRGASRPDGDHPRLPERYLSAHWAGRCRHWIRTGTDPAASARPDAVSTVRHCWAVRYWSQPRSQALTGFENHLTPKSRCRR